METQKYFEQKKDFQSGLLEFLDDEDKKMENFLSFFEQINDFSVYEDKTELLPMLQLIIQISNDHHRNPYFFTKLDQIFTHLKDTIKNIFTNLEIFDIFQSNKRLLLFLVEEEALVFDQSIFDLINDENFTKKDYLLYFWPELEKFASEELKKEMEERHNDLLQKSSRIFDDCRKEGENDIKICKIIRNDEVEDFIAYHNTTYLSPSSNVYPSPFETNQYLLLKNTTLIEYAAFFGSVKIFEYLRMNNVVLTPSLWLYAMHGRSVELIHMLEESGVKPDDKTYKECYLESIKCHHNNIANYVEKNLMKVNPEDKFSITSKIVQSLNFIFFPVDLTDMMAFFSFCQYNLIPFAKMFMKNQNLDINKKILQNNPSGLHVLIEIFFEYRFNFKKFE